MEQIGIALNSQRPRDELVLRVIASLGQKTLAVLQELSSLIGFVGETISEAHSRYKKGHRIMAFTNFIAQADRVGVGSVPLVAMVSLFLGLTMALLTGYQLQRFGTERLIPTLISIAFTRELGPLLTGIVVAARTGAAYTAEIGSMTVSEEVDAIESMGIGPLRYLAGPRLLAVFLFLPCLSVVSDVAGIFGASLVAQARFNMSFGYFYDEVMASLVVRDIMAGIVKSFLFGAIIGIVACYKGFTVRGGASGVGTATTSSVVSTITMVIACDTLCNIVLVAITP